MNNQAFSKIWIVVVAVALLAGGVLAWQYLDKPKEEVEAPKVEAPKNETADWKTYRNEEFGFEIKIPEKWFVEGKTIFHKKGGCVAGQIRNLNSWRKLLVAM